MNTKIPEKVIEIAGVKPGSTSIILVGVHGNEVCGVEAMDQLLPTLKIESGKVFIAYANPQAIEQGVRFTHANLNRMFLPEKQLSSEQLNSYEFSRANYLKQYLKQADALLDVHASTNPESQPFIICERNSKAIISTLPVNTVVYGFDEVEPGGTDYYMNSLGKIGICVECGFLGNPKSTEIAKTSIMHFLIAQGHISGQKKIYSQSYINMFQLYKTKTSNFRLAKPFKDFEELSKGKLIALDGQKEIKADRDSIILFAKNLDMAAQEAFLLGEKISAPSQK